MVNPPGAPPAHPQMVVLYTPPAPEKVSDSGLTLGVRLGAGLPNGKVVPADPAHNQTGEATDAFGVMIPVTLDVEYRLTPHWSVGAYLGIGYTTGPNCSSGGTDAATCSETVYRFGVEAQYRLFPTSFLEPWAAAGLGWEVANQFASDAESGESQDSNSGLEFAHLAIGADFRVLDRVTFGPYFETTFCEYEKYTSSNLNGEVHEWFIFGARVRYDTNWLRVR